jgi:hypothetical protein
VVRTQVLSVSEKNRVSKASGSADKHLVASPLAAADSGFNATDTELSMEDVGLDDLWDASQGSYNNPYNPTFF